MNRFSLSVLLMLFPVLVLGDNSSSFSNSLSFTPPSSDFSVIFLGDIFGVVDGVLYGTGSQIMGQMFGVFNAAVLSLGGIVITYTLIVSTMNTAHEGQMLGQKWSSIWIPFRSTCGLALMIPKTSGYCLIQIFVMWIVLQGVGAADKVWNTALNYLNNGGVIIQPQINPAKALFAATKSGISQGTQYMLAGQVCMIGLQNQLQNMLQSYQSQKQIGAGPCTGNMTNQMQAFCSSTIPDFVGTFDATGYQASQGITTSYSLPMPNFDPGSPFNFLNGICGTITWNYFDPTTANGASQLNALSNLNTNLYGQSTMATMGQARAAAIQAMYQDLTNLAQTMVSNDPALTPPAQNQGGGSSSTTNSLNNFSPMAVEEFGVPQTAIGTLCQDSTTKNCVLWGSTQGGAGAGTTLLNGTEFQDAIAVYDALMLGPLNQIREAQNAGLANRSRAFITEASMSGWLMAGSYFFYLTNLNVLGNSGGDQVDTATGLENSTFSLGPLLQAFGPNGTCNLNSIYSELCTWLNNDQNQVVPIVQLIIGATSPSTPGTSSLPTLTPGQILSVIPGIQSSTVLGYVNNASIIQLPGQPGLAPLKFANLMSYKIDPNNYSLPTQSFSCGGITIIFFTFCLGETLGDLFYNDIFVNIYNVFLNLFGKIINQTIMAFVTIPIEAMSKIFKQGLEIIDAPGVNPIVALATMGTYYINFAGQMWLTMIEISVTCSLIPIFGIFIFALISLVMPIIFAWLGIMATIGFLTSFYVPLVPYIMFTFGGIAWIMAVIEAMVAAPIVALGITHPEGHDAFGKGEGAIMILLNVFLRPSMMIIGYIAAIALSYVSVWIINAGFDNAIGFVQGQKLFGTLGSNGTESPTTLAISGVSNPLEPSTAAGGMTLGGGQQVVLGTQGTTVDSYGVIEGGYNGWAGIFAYFFSILSYTMLYVTVVQKSFGLISALPDKVLRWIGGQQESYGAETAQWGDEMKGKIGEAGTATLDKQAQMDKSMTGKFGKAKKALGGGGGGGISLTGGESGGEGGEGEGKD